MIISFVGHSKMPIDEELRRIIKKAIRDNIENSSFVTFYCGGYGNFDICCAQICKELKNEAFNCEVVYIIPYLNTQVKNAIEHELYDAIVYPPLEDVFPRFAIKKRNEWMMQNSDLIIAYVCKDYGGAFETLRYAKRLKKRILNLADGTEK